MQDSDDSTVVCSAIGKSFVVFDRQNHDAWLQTFDGVNVLLAR